MGFGTTSWEIGWDSSTMKFMFICVNKKGKELVERWHALNLI